MPEQGFPNSPAVNDTTILNGMTYKFNGSAWDKVAGAVSTEIPFATQVDLDAAVAVSTTQTGDIAGLTTAMGNETSARTTAISAEASARTAAISAEASARTTAISAEASARTSGQTAQDTLISSLQSSMATNNTDITSLQSDITDASRLTSGTLPSARIAGGSITDSMLNSTKLNGIEAGARKNMTKTEIEDLGLYGSTSPIIALSATVDELGSVVGTISNYDANATYSITAALGSVSYDNSSATFSFTAHDVTDGDDDIDTLTISSSKLGELKTEVTVNIGINYVPAMVVANPYASSAAKTVGLAILADGSVFGASILAESNMYSWDGTIWSTQSGNNLTTYASNILAVPVADKTSADALNGADTPYAFHNSHGLLHYSGGWKNTSNQSWLTGVSYGPVAHAATNGNCDGCSTCNWIDIMDETWASVVGQNFDVVVSGIYSDAQWYSYGYRTGSTDARMWADNLHDRHSSGTYNFQATSSSFNVKFQGISYGNCCGCASAGAAVATITVTSAEFQ